MHALREIDCLCIHNFLIISLCVVVRRRCIQSELMEAVDLSDVQKYTNLVYQYDKTKAKLDDQMVFLLTEIKRIIKGDYDATKLHFEESTAHSRGASGGGGRTINVNPNAVSAVEVEYDMQSDLSGGSSAPTSAQIAAAKQKELAAKANAMYSSASGSGSGSGSAAAAGGGGGGGGGGGAAGLSPPTPVHTIAASAGAGGAPPPIPRKPTIPGDRKAPPPPIPAKPAGMKAATAPGGGGTAPSALHFPSQLPTIAHDPTSPAVYDARDTKTSGDHRDSDEPNMQ